MSFIWSLIVGGILGWIGSLIVGKDLPAGVFGNIIAGIIGAWIGSAILGNWGPELGGYSIIPALIGAVVLVFLYSLIARGMRKAT